MNCIGESSEIGFTVTDNALNLLRLSKQDSSCLFSIFSYVRTNTSFISTSCTSCRELYLIQGKIHEPKMKLCFVLSVNYSFIFLVQWF